jgi:hypothetical protein
VATSGFSLRLGVNASHLPPLDSRQTRAEDHQPLFLLVHARTLSFSLSLSLLFSRTPARGIRPSRFPRRSPARAHARVRDDAESGSLLRGGECMSALVAPSRERALGRSGIRRRGATIRRDAMSPRPRDACRHELLFHWPPTAAAAFATPPVKIGRGRCAAAVAASNQCEPANSVVTLVAAFAKTAAAAVAMGTKAACGNIAPRTDGRHRLDAICKRSP